MLSPLTITLPFTPMTSLEHRQMIAQCESLLAHWEAVSARFSADAAWDGLQGLERTAEVGELSASAIKGCINGLRDVVAAQKGED